MAGKVCGCVLIIAVSLIGNFASGTKIDCVPVKLCPLAMRLIKTKPFAPETVDFLRYSHCGHDGEGPKVWCTFILQCKTPDSRDGVCKKIKDCSPFMDYIDRVDVENPIVKKYLREYRCSTEPDPEIKVCCPEESKTIPEILLDSTTVGTFSTNDLHERFSNAFPDPEMEECGHQSSENRIVGGVDTDLGEYPWLALLKYSNNGKTQYACTGSLINDEYVLTAAHCVDTFILRSKDLGRLQSIILGEYDIRNETDCIYQSSGADCADPPQIFKPANFTLHPQYNSSRMRNDIALVRLDRKAKFTDYVRPICLPSPGFTLRDNSTFTISGWGRTETEKNSPVKRKTRLNLAQRDRCDKLNGKRRITSRQLCVGAGGGVDNCYGDSGGPLMLDLKIRTGFATFAIGVVSYGYGQLCGSFPGVYTYLPPYLDWIEQQIR